MFSVTVNILSWSWFWPWIIFLCQIFQMRCRYVVQMLSLYLGHTHLYLTVWDWVCFGSSFLLTCMWGPSFWVPATHMGGLDWVSACFGLTPVLAIVGKWEWSSRWEPSMSSDHPKTFDETKGKEQIKVSFGGARNVVEWTLVSHSTALVWVPAVLLPSQPPSRGFLPQVTPNVCPCFSLWGAASLFSCFRVFALAVA